MAFVNCISCYTYSTKCWMAWLSMYLKWKARNWTQPPWHVLPVVWPLNHDWPLRQPPAYYQTCMNLDLRQDILWSIFTYSIYCFMFQSWVEAVGSGRQNPRSSNYLTEVFTAVCPYHKQWLNGTSCKNTIEAMKPCYKAKRAEHIFVLSLRIHKICLCG